mmetsp:Transcript_17207/g.25490  ORF Transcript_17207/g.25490 Transcript_17207/m.25490 type:complete len:171 (-) Transcript_17207:1018-1530(-)
MNLKSKFLVPLIFFFKCGIILSYSYKKKFDYAVVVDAGSMGSRVFIYHLTEAENGMGLDIKAKPSKNITPGLATYHENPEKSFSYLEPLVEYAKENIPQESHRQTPFFSYGYSWDAIDKRRFSAKDLRFLVRKFHFGSILPLQSSPLLAPDNFRGNGGLLRSHFDELSGQ